MIKENVAEVEARIQAACERAGRRREEVTLIAVSKTKPVSDIYEVMELSLIHIYGRTGLCQHLSQADGTGSSITGRTLSGRMVSSFDTIPRERVGENIYGMVFWITQEKKEGFRCCRQTASQNIAHFRQSGLFR